MGKVNARAELPRHTRGQCGGVGGLSQMRGGLNVEWAFVEDPLRRAVPHSALWVLQQDTFTAQLFNALREPMCGCLCDARQSQTQACTCPRPALAGV